MRDLPYDLIRHILKRIEGCLYVDFLRFPDRHILVRFRFERADRGIAVESHFGEVHELMESALDGIFELNGDTIASRERVVNHWGACVHLIPEATQANPGLGRFDALYNQGISGITPDQPPASAESARRNYVNMFADEDIPPAFDTVTRERIEQDEAEIHSAVERFVGTYNDQHSSSSCVIKAVEMRTETDKLKTDTGNYIYNRFHNVLTFHICCHAADDDESEAATASSQATLPSWMQQIVQPFQLIMQGLKREPSSG